MRWFQGAIILGIVLLGNPDSVSAQCRGGSPKGGGGAMSGQRSFGGGQGIGMQTPGGGGMGQCRSRGNTGFGSPQGGASFGTQTFGQTGTGMQPQGGTGFGTPLGRGLTSFGTPFGGNGFGTPLGNSSNGFGTPLGKGGNGFGTPLGNGGNSFSNPLANATGQQALLRGFTMLNTIVPQLQSSQLTTSWVPVQMLGQDLQLLVQINQNNSLSPAQKNAMALQVMQQAITDMQNVLSNPNLPASTQTALSGLVQQMQQLVQVAQQNGMGNGAQAQGAFGY